MSKFWHFLLSSFFFFSFFYYFKNNSIVPQILQSLEIPDTYCIAHKSPTFLVFNNLDISKHDATDPCNVPHNNKLYRDAPQQSNTSRKNTFYWTAKFQ